MKDPDLFSTAQFSAPQFAARRSWPLSLAFAAGAALAASPTFAPAALADTFTWRASPADRSWNLTSPNWNAGEAWVDGGSAVFPSSLTDNPTIAVDGARRASDVTFDAKCTIDGPGTIEVTGKLFANASATINAGFGGSSVRLGGASDKLLTMKGGNSSQTVTYIEDDAIFYVNDDLRFGPVPQSQTDSIVVESGNPGLYLSSTPQLAATRTIRIAPGAVLRLGNNTSGTQQTSIKSLICGTPDATLGYVTNTTVSFVNPWRNWNVNILFDPGEGRTNQIGRLNVATRLKIANGATLVAAPLTLKTGTDAPLYVHCWATTNQYGAYHGNLTVDGGALVCPQSGKYVDVGSYGQVTVTNGGLVFMPDVEWLNGLNSPGRLSISDGGKVVLKTLRLTFSSTAGSEVRLGDGGLLSADILGLCPPSSAHKCDFIFNGGAVQSRSGRTDFMRSTTGTALTESDWSGVRFLVGAKGAEFDTTNLQNLWWSRPLASGTDAGVPDGGVRVAGAGNGKGVIFTAANSYTGPTVVSNAMLQARADGALPAGTAVRLENGKLFAYDFANSAPRVTAQSVSRLEGWGIVYYAGALSVNGAVAPDAGKDLDIQAVCQRLAGDFEVRGGTGGCGRLLVAPGQDVSELRITLANPSAIDKGARHEILAASSGAFSGRLDESALPDGWRVKYTASSVTLSYAQPTTLFIR